MDRRESGALNDMTVATEYLMVAVREIARGAAVSTPAGASAVAAGLMVGMADPVPLVASVATGGIGMVGRGSLAARAAIGAVAGGATNAAIDLSSQAALDDPYADPVIAGAVGAAFGAVGGILARNKAAKDIAAEAYDTGLTFSVRARDARNKAAADIDPTLPRIDPPKGSVGAGGNIQNGQSCGTPTQSLTPCFRRSGNGR